MTDLAQHDERRLKWMLLLLAVTAALMGAVLALFPAAGHDQLCVLLMARRWMGGAVLYGPQVFDSNPPGVVWASALAVRLGEWLHVAATLPAKVLVLLLEAIVAWVCATVLRGRKQTVPQYYWAGLLFAYVALVLVVPARDFGQRDQLLSFLVLPYVLAAAVPQTRWEIRALAGVLAGVGICLKAQYVVIPVVVEFFILLAPEGSWKSCLRRLFRLENLLLVGFGAAYLVAIRHCAPLYFSSALPLLQKTYWAVGRLTRPQLLWQAIELIVLAALAVGMHIVSATRSRVTRKLLVAGVAAFTAYFVQGTGWYYQQIPAIVLFGAALAIDLAEAAGQREWRVPGWALPCTAAVCVLAVGLTTHFMGYPFTQDRSFAIEVPDPGFFAHLPEGTPVAMITTSVDAAMMPVERYHLTWAQRTNNVWTLPAILRSEAGSDRMSAAEVAELAAMQHRWMVEDLQRWNPELVLVQRCQDTPCQLLEDRHDDLLAWFARDPAFAAVWAAYRFERRSGAFDAYVRVQRPTGGTPR